MNLNHFVETFSGDHYYEPQEESNPPPLPDKDYLEPEPLQILPAASPSGPPSVSPPLPPCPKRQSSLSQRKSTVMSPQEIQKVTEMKKEISFPETTAGRVKV